VEEDVRSPTGLILGKFMPPHRGHMDLIEAARARVDLLTILVCSRAGEPIPGHVRYAWMRELAPAARVLPITDENPALPEDDPDFWEIWVASIRRAVPEGPHLVFAGEPYGHELARRLGARAVVVDRALSVHPTSASAIRADPLGHWDELLPPVRGHYALRVVVTGSESTGKTTLAERLARHFETVWIPEFARGYLDAKPTPLDPSDIEPIARGQIAAEDAGAREANRVVFLDTDLASTEVYAEHYYGVCPAWIREEGRRRSPHLYLLAGIDAPWVADPQRDRGHMRADMHDLFRRRIAAAARTPVVEVVGSWNERFETARTAVEELLRQSSA
jgi:HTH-type transcriptional repressor of NAD biosynthesis genes